MSDTNDVRQCTFKAMIKGADTWEASESQCHFKKCGKIDSVARFEKHPREGHKIFTVLEGSAMPMLARKQDAMISSGCEDLGTVHKKSRRARGISCLQLSYVAGADLYEEADVWCHLFKCGAYKSVSLKVPAYYTRAAGDVYTTLGEWSQLAAAKRGVTTGCMEVEGFTEHVRPEDCKYEAAKVGADTYRIWNSTCYFEECGNLGHVTLSFTQKAGDIYTLLAVPEGGVAFPTTTLDPDATTTTADPNATTTAPIDTTDGLVTTTTKPKRMMVDHGGRAAYSVAVVLVSIALSMAA